MPLLVSLPRHFHKGVSKGEILLWDRSDDDDGGGGDDDDDDGDDGGDDDGGSSDDVDVIHLNFFLYVCMQFCDRLLKMVSFMILFLKLLQKLQQHLLIIHEIQKKNKTYNIFSRCY